MNLGIGIGLPFSRVYNGMPYKSELISWIKKDSRRGLTLVDSINELNNVTILPSTVYTSTNGYAYYTDINNDLDINNSILSLSCWIKGGTPTARADLAFLVGKNNVGMIVGAYGIYCTTDNKITALVRTSTGIKTKISNVLITDEQWHHIVMIVDAINGTLRLIIDNVEVGTPLSITGTINAMPNTYKFTIGTATTTDGSTFWGTLANCYYADVVVAKRTLTSNEILTLYNKGYISNVVAYYPCSSYILNDVSGYNRHMTKVNIGINNIKYSDKASRIQLDKGYSLYKKDSNADIYVPNLLTGQVLDSPLLPSGFIRHLFTDGSEHIVYGDELNHNYADTLLNMVGDNWDRSNTVIFNNNARVAGTTQGTKYLSATPNAWHSSLINRDWMNYFYNKEYKGLTFPKSYPNSAYDTIKLLEIFEYSVNKTESDYTNVLKYTKDSEWYHTIDYYFEDSHIVTQKENKVLFFNYSTKVLSYSVDGGNTILNSKNLNGIETIINDAYIWDNGNISFAGHKKYYISKDNLSSYQEVIVKDISGNVYIASDYNNFRPYCSDAYMYNNGKEFRAWGAYSIDPGTINTNINVWISTDNGETVKSTYKFGVSSPLLNATHVHAVIWDAINNFLWVFTGDTNGTVQWMKGIYNVDNDKFDFEAVVTGSDLDGYKIAGMAIYENRMVWASDSSSLYSQGIYRGDYSSPIDQTKWRRANYINNSAKNIYTLFKDSTNVLGAEAGGTAIFSSSNQGKYFIRHTLVGSPTLYPTYGGYLNFIPKNSEGYYRADIYEDVESATTNGWERGTVLMVKILK